MSRYLRIFLELSSREMSRIMGNQSARLSSTYSTYNTIRTPPTHPTCLPPTTTYYARVGYDMDVYGIWYGVVSWYGMVWYGWLGHEPRTYNSPLQPVVKRVACHHIIINNMYATGKRPGSSPERAQLGVMYTSILSLSLSLPLTRQ